MAWLAAALRDGRIGFHRTWPAQIAAFTRAHRDDPTRFLPAAGEPFADARDRIAGAVTGLGPAKSSFALGLIYPFEATVCCIDTHIARMLAPLMGCSPARVPCCYTEAEALLREVASRVTRRSVRVEMNTADRPEDDLFFLTATGTSARSVVR